MGERQSVFSEDIATFIFTVVHYVGDVQIKVYLKINSPASNLKEGVTVLPPNGDLLNLNKI